MAGTCNHRSVPQMAASCSNSSETKRLVDKLKAEVSQERRRRQLRVDKARTRDAAASKKAKCGTSTLQTPLQAKTSLAEVKKVVASLSCCDILAVLDACNQGFVCAATVCSQASSVGTVYSHAALMSLVQPVGDRQNWARLIATHACPMHVK
jgi:hypothetical protein